MLQVASKSDDNSWHNLRPWIHYFLDIFEDTMKVLSKAILLSLVPFHETSGADAIAVGDEVCITGYMMDQCAYIMLSACSRRMHLVKDLPSCHYALTTLNDLTT